MDELETSIAQLSALNVPEEHDTLLARIEKVFLNETPEGDIDYLVDLIFQLCKKRVASDNYYFDANTSLANIITEQRLLSRLEELYSALDFRALFIFYVIGYFMGFKRVQFSRVVKIVLKYKECIHYFLNDKNTSSLMVGLLVAINEKSSPISRGKDKSTVGKILRQFLLSGERSPEEIAYALLPTGPANISSDLLVIYVLKLLGFKKTEIEVISSIWRDYGQFVEIVSHSILPNLATMLFVETQQPKAVVELHRIFGLINFARYEVEQFIHQYRVHLEARNSSKQPYVLHVALDHDTTGAMLNRSESLWTPIRHQLVGKKINFIAIETGSSFESIINSIQSVASMLGKANEIIFSAHVSPKGLMYTDINGDRQHISIRDFETKILPVFFASMRDDGTLILNVCEHALFKEMKRNKRIIIPNGDRNALLRINVEDDGTLHPVFAEWSFEEYIRYLLQNVRRIKNSMQPH